MFADKGFHGASVEEICERAGFTRGAFYSNFSSKDDLVLELSERQVERVMDRIRTAAVAQGDPRDVLQAVLDAATRDEQQGQQWYLLAAEFELHALRTPAARATWARHQRQVREAVGRAVDDLCEANGLTLPMPTQQFVRVVITLARGSVAQRMVEPRAVRRGALEQAVIPLLLGLPTPSFS